MDLTINQVASLLKEKDNILILTHASPDGDTLGSGSALTLMLRKLGKKANFVCSDPIGEKYDYMLADIKPMEFEPEFIVSTDVADQKLLGETLLASYEGKVDLAIDHHASNKDFAKMRIVDSTCCAACELVYHIANEMGVEIDSHIANCLYTGICTDSGCLKYNNVTPSTLRTCANLIEKGAAHAKINKIMFDTKSRERIELERLVMNTLEFYFEGKCAVITVKQQMQKDANSIPTDLDGFASMPIGIKGVEIGITMQQKKDGVYKVSLRTTPNINASEICALFGGGGHVAASGCKMNDNLEQSKQSLLEASKNALIKAGLING